MSRLLVDAKMTSDELGFESVQFVHNKINMNHKTVEDSEKELYYLQRQKISAQEKNITQLNEQLGAIKNKYDDLFSDYQHNLTVIKDRDVELDEITAKLIEMKRVLDKRTNDYVQIETKFREATDEWQQEKTALKAKMDQMKKEYKYSRKLHEEEVAQLQNALKQHTYQLENLKNEKAVQRQSIENRIRENVQQVESDYSARIQRLQTEIGSLTEKIQGYEQQEQKLKEENKQLNNKLLRIQAQLNEQAIQYQSDTQILRQKLQQQQLICDQLKKDIDDFRDGSERNEKNVQQRLVQLTYEKQQLEFQLLELKQQKKQKIRVLKDNQQRLLHGLHQESEETIKKLEFQIQQLTIEHEKQLLAESNLKDKLQEMESKLSRVSADYEQRMQLQGRNLEQDKKQLKNEIEHKQILLGQAQDEISRLKGTIVESNKLMDNLANKVQELKCENNMLVEEVVQLRKVKKVEPSPREEQKNKSNQLKVNTEVKVQKKVNTHFLADADEAESFEKQFSGDEGPVPSVFHYGSIMMGKSSKPNQNNSRVRQLEQENQKLKLLIQDMGMSMETTKDQLMLKVQELNIARQNYAQVQDRMTQLIQDCSRYKEQILNLQNQLRQSEQNEQQLKQMKEEIEQLTKKLQNSKEVIVQLRKEREKLLEITNDLNQKLRDQDNQEDLIALQTEVKYLQNQVRQLQLPANQKSQLPNLSEIQNQLFK